MVLLLFPWGSVTLDWTRSAPCGLARPGVLADARPEVHKHARLAANGPGVMAGFGHEGVAGGELLLGAVVHLDAHAAGQDVAEVRRLAGGGLRKGLDMFR